MIIIIIILILIRAISFIRWGPQKESPSCLCPLLTASPTTTTEACWKGSRQSVFVYSTATSFLSQVHRRASLFLAWHAQATLMSGNRYNICKHATTFANISCTKANCLQMGLYVIECWIYHSSTTESYSPGQKLDNLHNSKSMDCQAPVGLAEHISRSATD